jgi:WXG100 family type VII secretion target
MAGGGYGTTPEEMQRAAARVMSVNDQVQANLASLRNQMAPLAGAWQGQAATAFQGLMARWDTDARSLNEALRGIGEAIRGTGQNYAQAEEQHSQSLSAIQNALA